MDYITRFYTTAEFTTAEPNLARPHVSLTKDNYVVHYMPVASQGGSQGGDTPVVTHDYVEIAGVKWATMNIGAQNVTDPGLYFQWGDTQGYTADQVGSDDGQKPFTLKDYKYYKSADGSGSGDITSNITKYNSTDGKTVLEASDDAVTAAWGGNWRMPTDAEYTALFGVVNTAWTSDYQGSGVAGFVCTDTSDSSKVLFFPTCGKCDNGSVEDVDRCGYYWSSSLSSISSANAVCRFFNSYNTVAPQHGDRYVGRSVRGILDEPNNQQIGSGSGSGSGNG